jgi:hypothetical protein
MDDNKKPTVEDQELADMIANLNGPAPKPAAANTAPTPPPLTPPPLKPNPPASPAPATPLPPISPAPSSTPNPTPPPAAPPASSLPPLPPAPAPSIPPKPSASALPPIPPTPQPAPSIPPLPPKPAAPAPAPTSSLGSIKKSALDELRPLVSKLDLPAEEKFDTLLLLIRSTDDQALISQAYDTAKQIKDETRRAEALLDIVKEIDFFENPHN